MEKYVSIILPVFNERGSVEKILKEINTIKQDDEKYEIIVVDDGSTDGLEHEKIRPLVDQLLIHPYNMGYGAAIKTGMRHANGEVIVIIDADGTYAVSDIPRLIERLKHCDMVVGARTGDVVKIPLLRQPAKFILTKLANYLAGEKIPDLNSGLRAFRKRDAEKFLHLLPRGFSLTATLTLAYLSSDLLVEYIPINYLPRVGKSKIRPLYDTQNILLTILRTIIYFNPLKVCVPLSLILAILAILVLVVSGLFTSKIMDGTVAVLSLTAVQVLVIGLLADLIVRRSG
ncbi:MAG: glycosyltransferase family 2 protein [Candidatus Sumerlaeia bacterium]|nr:glycosyltransferase family 2 protein [Candidatus Sumerlaeia bacterium]